MKPENKTIVVEDSPTSGPIPWTDDMDLIHRNPKRDTADLPEDWVSTGVADGPNGLVETGHSASVTIVEPAHADVPRSTAALAASTPIQTDDSQPASESGRK